MLLGACFQRGAHPGQAGASPTWVDVAVDTGCPHGRVYTAEGLELAVLRPDTTASTRSYIRPCFRTPLRSWRQRVLGLCAWLIPLVWYRGGFTHALCRENGTRTPCAFFFDECAGKAGDQAGDQAGPAERVWVHVEETLRGGLRHFWLRAIVQVMRREDIHACPLFAVRDL